MFHNKSGRISVSVAFCVGSIQRIIHCDCEHGTTIEQAIEQSDMAKEFPEIVIQDDRVGIYSEKRTLNTVLKNNDRVEIYRSLSLSPAESRKLRAQKKALLK